ncbi:MAG: MmgE/PrpD family protein, partial [Solirubrobacterales bacterium]
MDNDALEKAVATFVVSFGEAHLRDETRRALRLLLKDQLSVQIGVSRLPWARQIRAYAEETRLPGNATVVAEEEKMDASSAAFVNAS